MSFSLPETYKFIRGGPGEEPTIRELPIPKPSTNQVLVKMAYAPINPTEIARLNGICISFRGPINPDPNLNGIEGSGTIVAVGENLAVNHKVGDRVHVLGPGTLGQYLLTTSEMCSPILQDDLSLEEAASHYVNPATVYYMGILADKGGHKAVINTVGSSALGRMLIRLLKYKGIKQIQIVRRDEYIEELKNEGADYVLNSKAPDFEAQLKELAEKENATLSFDAIAGEFTNTVLKCQPPNSVCVVYGALEGFEVKKIDAFELFSGKSVSGLFLPPVVKELDAKGELKTFTDEVHSLLPTVLKTNIYKIYSMDEFKEALADYNENSSKGKVLIKLN